jgi:hypothetical protein
MQSSWLRANSDITLRHTKIRIPTDRGLGDLFRNPKASIRIAKWAGELSSCDITFEPRIAIKSNVLADFIVDWTGPSVSNHQNKETIWTIHCDGAWCHAGAGATTIITSPLGVKYRYFALESEYEVVILGLRKLRDLGVTTCIVKTDSRLSPNKLKKIAQPRS